MTDSGTTAAGASEEMSELRSGNLMIEAAGYFAALSERLHAGFEETVTLERICQQALEVVAPAEFCAITLRRRRGKLETVAATDPLVGEANELQYQLGEGPSWDSALDQGAFLIHNTATERRWPRWAPQAADLGVRSLIAVQLTAPQGDGVEPMGAINLYAGKINAFSVEDLDRTLIFASHAADALASAQLVTGLETAIHSRHLIGVAQGILMHRYGLTMERSFDALRRYSSDANIKLRDLAQLVVDNHKLPDRAP